MKRMARFGIVVLSAFLLMSCLTDPVELPNEGNGTDTEQNVKPEDKLEPLPPVSDPTLDKILNPCEEFPNWYMGHKMDVISIKENGEILYPSESESSGMTQTPDDSIYSRCVPVGSSGSARYVNENKYIMHIESPRPKVGIVVTDIIIERNVENPENPIFTYIRKAKAGSESKTFEMKTIYSEK